MRIVLTFTMLFIALSSYGQVTIEEPEFAEQTLLVKSDTEGIMLPRENGFIKTKAGASIYLVGIGKIKSRITLNGPTTSVSTEQRPEIRLILKSVDNKTDPKSFISIFKFEVKPKIRQVQVSEIGTFGSSDQSLSSLDYNAKKYGEASYLIVLEDLEPGEYGIMIGDPNKLTEKNQLKITTFSVK